MDEFMGTIQAFGFNFAPRGWMLCQGQILSIAQNSALFSLLGTTYGGDGQTTFALPDLRGRVAVGQGQGPGLSSYNMGQRSGVENTTLTVANMPTHNHAATSVLNAEGLPGDKLGPANRLLAAGSASFTLYKDPNPGQPNIQMSDESVATTVAPAGGSQPFNILSPYLTINYSICLQGIFPSRN